MSDGQTGGQNVAEEKGVKGAKVVEENECFM